MALFSVCYGLMAALVSPNLARASRLLARFGDSCCYTPITHNAFSRTPAQILLFIALSDHSSVREDRRPC